MRGRRSIVTNRVCEFRGRRSVSVICKRCETKANPLRRSCASKRSRCGAVRVCLELGKPSSEIVGVEALTVRARLEPSVEIARVEELSQWRRAFVLLVVNPQRRSCVSKRSRRGAVRICLGLGKPSAEILRVCALSLWCRQNFAEIVRVEALSPWRCASLS